MNGFLGDIRQSFLATGVGSLPTADPLAAVQAVFETLEYHVPFWPQLPRRSFAENMVVQFAEGFPGARLDEGRRALWVDAVSADYPGELEECFNKCLAGDVDYFGISPARAAGLDLMVKRLMGASWQGWVKAQVIGPFSFGLSLLDQKKDPILYDPELGELLPLFLSLKAAWLIRQVKVHARTRVIVFIDEPYLVAVGTSQCTLRPEKIVAMINQVVRVIHDNGALAGLHCCGNTDWDLVMATDIDILNFDAYGYLDRLSLYEKSVKEFARRGGILAAGIVPNNQDLRQEGIEDRLFKTLREHPGFLKNGLLVTTCCGLSGLEEGLVREALTLCVRLADRLREEYS